ncbi:MAG: EB domain-containing protein, partial [Nanoarchaeota archaeon]|nr:EB domain-containing protein [Nanoarchaeota archaeon]
MFKRVVLTRKKIIFTLFLIISFALLVTFVSAQVSCGTAVCSTNEQCIGGRCTDILDSIQQVLSNSTLTNTQALLSIGQFLQAYFASPPPCTSDSHCQTNFICELGSCVALLADGSSCTADRECLSASCVSGICGVVPPPPTTTTLCATSPLCPGSFFPLSENEATGRGGDALLSERVEYWNTDSLGVFLLFYSSAKANKVQPEKLQLNLSLWNGNTLIQNLSIVNLSDYKLEIVVDMPRLAAGDYILKADVLNSVG